MKYIKIFEEQNFIKNKTQEEIDQQFRDSILTCNYVNFLDAIENGANVNQLILYHYSSLIHVFINVKNRNKKLEMMEDLIKNGANVYYEGPQNLDLYDWIINVNDKDVNFIIQKIILKYHPNFFEERELRKNVSTYNL